MQITRHKRKTARALSHSADSTPFMMFVRLYYFMHFFMWTHTLSDTLSDLKLKRISS
jgi:hypothetical protein